MLLASYQGTFWIAAKQQYSLLVICSAIVLTNFCLSSPQWHKARHLLLWTQDRYQIAPLWADLTANNARKSLLLWAPGRSLLMLEMMMVMGMVMIIKTRLPGPQKFAGSARTLLRSTRLCHQINATATDCIQAITILWFSHIIYQPHILNHNFYDDWGQRPVRYLPHLWLFNGSEKRVASSVFFTEGGFSASHIFALWMSPDQAAVPPTTMVHKWCTLWCTLWCTEVGSWVGESATANALNSSPSSSQSFWSSSPLGQSRPMVGKA